MTNQRRPSPSPIPITNSNVLVISPLPLPSEWGFGSKVFSHFFMPPPSVIFWWTMRLSRLHHALGRNRLLSTPRTARMSTIGEDAAAGAQKTKLFEARFCTRGLVP